MLQTTMDSNKKLVSTHVQNAVLYSMTMYSIVDEQRGVEPNCHIWKNTHTCTSKLFGPCTGVFDSVHVKFCTLAATLVLPH